jgi:hypothetical protein
MGEGRSRSTPVSPTSVILRSDNANHIEARVVKHGDREEELLNIQVNSLQIGREDVGGMSAEQSQASVVTVVALTWAT